MPIDETLADGTYEIRVVTDAAGSLIEPDETNNTASTTLELTRLAGPRIVDMTADPTAGFADVTFDRAILAGSLTTADCSLAGPGGAVAIQSVTHVDGLTYRVSFAKPTYAGVHTLSVGPNVTDSLGNRMDQNGDGVNGDGFAGDFDVQLPDLSPHTVVAGQTDLWFGQQVSLSYLVSNVGGASAAGAWSDRVWLSPTPTLGAGAVPLAMVSAGYGPVGAGGEGAGSATVTLPIDATLTDGTYYLIVEVNADRRLNEDAGGAGNQAASGPVNLATLPGPAIVTMSPTGEPGMPIGSVDVTFDVQIDPTSLTVADCSLVGPAGPVAIGGVQAVAGKANTYRVSFASQSTAGEYTLSVGPGVTDLLGNEMDQDGDGVNGDGFVGIFRVDRPDLVIDSVTPAASAAIMGQALDVSWIGRNADGLATTYGSWVDAVYLSTDAAWDAGDLRLGQAAGQSAGPGGTYVGAATVTLPLSVAWPGGTYYVIVIADANGSLGESNELNNAQVSTAVDVSFPATADLAARDVVQVLGDAGDPSVAASGGEVTVSWVTENLGTSGATGSWTERVYLSDDAAAGGDVLLGTFRYDGPLAAGGEVTRTETLTMPATDWQGTLRFVVVVDADNEVFELDEGNNAAVAAQGTFLSLGLIVNLRTDAADEWEAGVRGTVTRSGSLADPLDVYLSAWDYQGTADATEISLPAKVTIPAGQRTAEFVVTPLTDGIADGDQYAMILAEADLADNDPYNVDGEGEPAGYIIVGQAGLTIHDVDEPGIALTLGASQGIEGQTIDATVTIDPAPTADMEVSLYWQGSTQLSMPESVTILAGETSADFQIVIVDDVAPEAYMGLNVKAVSPLFGEAVATLGVIDNDATSLSLDLDAATIMENAFGIATWATVTRSVVTDRPQTVLIASSDPAAAQVISQVVIPAYQASARVAIAAVNNTVVDGERLVTITATPADPTTAEPIGGAATADLAVLDDDGLALAIVLDTLAISEAGTGGGVVRRNTADTSAELVVTLVSGDPGEATVPATVTIPIGETEAAFVITGVDDGVTDGSSPVTISASAAGFSPAAATMTVTDTDLPDLRVVALSTVQTALTDGTFDATWTIANDVADLTGSYVEKVYLTADEYLSESELLDTFLFDGSFAAGQSYTRNVQFHAPDVPGDYRLVVVVDAAGAVAELDETNNVATAVDPLTVSVAYEATVEALETQVPAGTPITVRGLATATDTGLPVAYKLVSIHILHNGSVRTIAAITDEHGLYETTWRPLANEAGDYGVAAGHPEAGVGAAQDSFTLLGMAAAEDWVIERLYVGDVVSGSVTIENRSSVALTGLTATLTGVGANLDVQVSLSDATLAGGGQITLDYTIEALTLDPDWTEWSVEIASAEGVSLAVDGFTEVFPLSSKLWGPSEIVDGMVRGSVKTIELTIGNDGRESTGPIEVLLPETEFMSVAGPTTLAPLAAGERTVITLTLAADEDLALGRYAGTIVIRGDDNSLTVPYDLVCASDAVGDVQVSVVDELTYYGDGGGLAGATVSLRDTYTGQTVASGVTGADGVVTFTGIAEQRYTLDITAEGHRAYESIVTILPGQTVEKEVLLQMRLVSYNWTVEEIEIEDRYEIKLETTFETNVPLPVVVVEPAMIVLGDLTFVDGQAMTNLTISNKGLVAAEDVWLSFPDSTQIEVVPLVENLGKLNAQSSMTVPVFIRRLDGGTAEDAQAAAVAAGTTVLTVGKVAWDIACGLYNAGHEFTIPVIDDDNPNVPPPGPDDTEPGPPPPAPPTYPPPGPSEPGGPGDVPKPRPTGGGGGGGGDGDEEPSTSPGGGGGGEYTPEEDDWCKCDPSTYKPVSMQLEGGLDASGILNWLSEKVAARLASPPWYVSGIVAKVAGSLGLKTKCDSETEKIQLQLDGSLQYALEFPIFYGVSTPFFSYEIVNPDGTKYSVNFELKGGVEIKFYGNFTMGFSSDWNLANSELSFSGQLGVEVKPQVTVEGMVKKWDWVNGWRDYAGLSGSVFVSIPGGLHVSGKMTSKGTSSFDYGFFLGPGSVGVSVQAAAPDGWYLKKQYSVEMFPKLPRTAEVAEIETPDLSFSADDAARMLGYASAEELITSYENTPVVAEEPAGPETISAEQMALALAMAGGQVAPVQAGRFAYVSSVISADEARAAATGGGTCADVKLQLSQDATMTRKAFAATLAVTNHSLSYPLTDFTNVLSIFDADGELANGKFTVLTPELTGFQVVSTAQPPADWDYEVDGPYAGSTTYQLPADTTGSLRWVIIPTDDAAVDDVTIYSIGGYFNYTINGVGNAHVLTPGPIQVLPDASLDLKYFWQRDVYSDDPYTEEVEPAEPFNLAILATNNGRGTAYDFQITSAQPRIVDNEKGLFVDFEILATEIDGVGMTPTLRADFGDIAPGQSVAGRWIFTSSLQGHFTDYNASFEHIDSLGGLVPSLIDSVTIHELIHVVYAAGAFDDGRYDYLVNDIADETYEPIPDTLHLSDGSIAPVTLGSLTSRTILGASDGMEVILDVLMPDEWGYLKIDDPADESMILDRVVRLDESGNEIGEVIVGDNVWRTDRSFKEPEEPPVYEDKLHLFDYGGAAGYKLVYVAADETAPEVEEIETPAGPRLDPVGGVEVTFTEQLAGGTFTAADITLTRDGSPVDVGSLTVDYVSGSTYRVDGLAALTGQGGVYELTVSAAGVVDLSGNAGTGSRSVTWVNATGAPVVLAIIGAPTGTVNSMDANLYVKFSQAIDPATFDVGDLTFSRDGGANLIDPGVVTVHQVSADTYRIAGLADLATADGTYTLTVDASGVAAPDATAGFSSLSAVWTMDQTGPTIVATSGAPSGAIAEAVAGFDVVFSSSLAAGSFDAADLTLTRDGGANLVNAGVTVTHASGATWRISGLSSLTASEGEYVLTIDAAGVKDVAGNAGTGQVAVVWTTDTTAPRRWST